MVICCILFCLGSYVDTSHEQSLDQFIAETRDLLNEICKNDRKSPKHVVQLYNLTDTLNIRDRTIKLTKFRILSSANMKVVDDSKPSFISLSCQDKIPSFDLDIYQHKDRTPSSNAYLDFMVSKPGMSGTDTMLLIHYMLSEIGVESCNLRNCAKLRYNYVLRDNDMLNANVTAIRYQESVPLIVLRCIKGKKSDWYSEFGYFNQRRARISFEMARIHDIRHGNQTFGPWLRALWNKPDKIDFRNAYQRYYTRFAFLMQLRDSSKWIAQIS